MKSWHRSPNEELAACPDSQTVWRDFVLCNKHAIHSRGLDIVFSAKEIRLVLPNESAMDLAAFDG